MTTPRPANTAGQGRAQIAVRLVAFTPLWVLLIVAFTSRTYFQPLFASPPSIVGIPLGAVIDAVAMLWMLIGVVLIWDARSPAVQTLVLVLFTIPATVAVVFSPAVVLIILNM